MSSITQIDHGFVDLPGAKIYYETAGEGEPVVFLHGGLLDGRMWDEQFSLFAQHYQVIRYDVRGAGKSCIVSSNEPYTPYQELANLLGHLRIQQACLVGLSGGARFAIDLALAYPQRVQKLVLVSPGMSGYHFVDAWTLRHEAAFEEALGQGDVTRALEHFLVMWVDGPSRSPEEVNARVRERCHQMASQAISQGSLALEWHELEPPAAGRLGAIHAATLIVLGEKDTSDIHTIGERLHKEIRDAELVKVPDVAHALTMEVPTLFNTLLSQFLRR